MCRPSDTDLRRLSAAGQSARGGRWLLALLIVFALGAGAPTVRAQAGGASTPDECFGFAFGPWEPPLRTVASKANPGGDPTTGAPAGAPRDWAARVANGRNAADSVHDSGGDSVLVLFPGWWPSGVAINWTGTRGDTLLGTAHALVADGRVPSPVSSVRGLRVPCGRPRPSGR